MIGIRSMELRLPMDRIAGGVAGLVREISLGATAAPECVAWYEHLGTPALFLPEASDSSLFRPAGQLKAHDITLSARITVFGGAWVGGPSSCGFAGYHLWFRLAGSRIETEAIPPLFAGSRIVLRYRCYPALRGLNGPEDA